MPMPTTPNPIAIAAARVQTDAQRGSYGIDGADVALLARSMMALSPEAAVRIGLLMVRAGLERNPGSLDQEIVAQDVMAIGRLILGFETPSAEAA